ncbi:hypothetical protein FPQ18DRAFT_378260 [Pyronema domesticum]|nr:hypothetical protein FPQ18DRAFT_378260 [Pyronema domesticum]
MFDESEIDISHIVTCLYKLSITIQNPASQHRVENFSKISMEIHRGLDTQHISDKFPLAADYLVQRLANANIMRRQFLEYYKKNYEKIKGNDKSNTDGTEAERIPEVQETPAEDTHLVPEPNAQTGPFIPDTATRQSILDAIHQPGILQLFPDDQSLRLVAGRAQSLIDELIKSGYDSDTMGF